MEELKQEVEDLARSRANDMDYVEIQLDTIKKSMDKMLKEIETLATQVNGQPPQPVTQPSGKPVPLPRQPPPYSALAVTSTSTSSSASSVTVNGLAKEIADIKLRIEAVEISNATKQSTEFGLYMTCTSDLSKNTWQKFDTISDLYIPSSCFDIQQCAFKAPVKGNYYLDMSVKQESDGSLEAAFNCKGTSPFKHSYVGNTHGDSTLCHKTIITSLNAGDVVFGIVRRITGTAMVKWCGFHGCLISNAVTGPVNQPSAPPPPPSSS